MSKSKTASVARTYSTRRGQEVDRKLGMRRNWCFSYSTYTGGKATGRIEDSGRPTCLYQLIKWMHLEKSFNFSGFWTHFCKTWGLETMGINVLSRIWKINRSLERLQVVYLKHNFSETLKILKAIIFFLLWQTFIHTLALILYYNLFFLICFPR